jgi:hypothetical protein
MARIGGCSVAITCIGRILVAATPGDEHGTEDGSFLLVNAVASASPL